MRPEDFSDFYREIHGHNPFPWQRDLPRQIVDAGCWPGLIDVPTGLGKTSMLDVGVFLAALDFDQVGEKRIGRRRIFLVVDRRVVVDQAESHAKKIAAGLANAGTGSLAAEVARRLRLLGHGPNEEQVLPVVKMRGGTSWDSVWLARPDVPGVVTGTVDQVGSRLLFRGYGVTTGRRPIDASLVGADSLILVDEAHLATVLTTTLASGAAYDSATASLGVPRPVVTKLTATSEGDGQGWTPAFDEASHLADAVAARRIMAHKHLRLERTSKAAAVKVLAEAAEKEAAEPGARVLVVCNTIDRARAVHALLSKSLPAESSPMLLIGRSRQFEREVVVERALDLFGAGRPETPEKAVLVATQTVEVGVDLDATALVSECPSWDALVQRLGRVNRRGERDGSVVVVDDDDPKPPVYGTARIATAEFLQELLADETGGLDVSPLALRRMDPPDGVFLARAEAPLLLPAHLDAWVRTNPAPVNDAPLDAYLHGIGRGTAPVSLVWRDGLLLADGTPAFTGEDELSSVLDVVPVRSEETVEVPLMAVRRWLAEERPVALSDWDEADDEWAPFGDTAARQVLRRVPREGGTSAWAWTSGSGIRPGDTVVAPVELGGLDEYGWAPSSLTPVLDVAEVAAFDRRNPVLRLDDGLPGRLGVDPPAEPLADLLAAWRATDEPETREALAEGLVEDLRSWIADSPAKCPTAWDHSYGPDGSTTRRQRLVELMEQATLEATRRSRARDNADSSTSSVATAILQMPRSTAASWRAATEETSDGTAHLDKRVTLSVHGEAVARRAIEIARNLRLAEPLIRAIGDAARWHDLGKVDQRFQAMLFNGDPVLAAIAGEPLAKSGMPAGDLKRHREARVRSGLPRGARHEGWSHALASEHLAGRAERYEGDEELMLHLIASHHGRARPLLPPIPDDAEHALEAVIEERRVTAALPKKVDLAFVKRFEALNERYGRWGLALLETIVRSADTTISGEGS